MKKLRLRIANNVDIGRKFTACVRGGEKYGHDSMCIETHSNYDFPTIRATANFVVVGIMREDDECDD